MILVYDIKIIDTIRDDIHFIHSYTPSVLGIAIKDFDGESKNIEITREMVKGKRFTNVFGREIVLGWDKQTQEILGLPFKIFESQERRRISDYKENTKLRMKIRKLENMSLLQFIKNKIMTIWS